MPAETVIEIARKAVPARVRMSGRLIASEESAGSQALQHNTILRASAGVTSNEAAGSEYGELDRKLRAYLRARRSKVASSKPAPTTADTHSGLSGDVEFRERTPSGVSSYVVQVRAGKVAQVLKRASLESGHAVRRKRLPKA
jgi:hypothetical protein